MAAALHHQCEAQDIIDNFAHEWFLPPAKAVELKRHIFILLKNYTALGQIADAEGKLLWNMTPKFHWLYHFGERAQFLSPRRGACLIDEDYVGKIKTIGQPITPAVARSIRVAAAAAAVAAARQLPFD